MYERYTGLILDMDGTALDTESMHRRAWHKVLGHHGLRLDEHAMITLNGSPTWRTAQSTIELNYTDLDPHVLACEKTDKVRSTPLNSVQPLPSVDVVKAWYGRRPMSVGTGSENAIAEALLVHFGLCRYFDAVATADHVQHHKPASDTFLLCIERTGVVPTRCVVFEDADFGIQAAHAAGTDAVDVRPL